MCTARTVEEEEITEAPEEDHTANNVEELLS